MRLTWHRRGGYDVDAHVLVRRSVHRTRWLDACVARLEAEPVNILLVYEPGANIGSARAVAFAACEAPFLCTVGDDDRIGVGAVDACVSAITGGDVVGVYTDMAMVNRAGIQTVTNRPPWRPQLHLRKPTGMLHLRVMRRAAVAQCVDDLATWPALDDMALNAMLVRHGNWRKVDVIGYHKREHAAGASYRIPRHLWRRYYAMAREIVPPAAPTPAPQIHGAPSRRSGVGCKGCARRSATIKRWLRPANR